jgi:hypothetical protein
MAVEAVNAPTHPPKINTARRKVKLINNKSGCVDTAVWIL